MSAAAVSANAAANGNAAESLCPGSPMQWCHPVAMDDKQLEIKSFCRKGKGFLCSQRLHMVFGAPYRVAYAFVRP